MDISMSEAADRGWIVRMGQCSVPFPSREAAGQFVERLRARLAAPHGLPGAQGHQTVMQETQDRP